ncbi:MAG: aminotransferase class IV [Candidatus Poribacteria bacterium]|nr:aminotransferase class IV [Candidatus Poribacteria bacterium]
MKELDYINGAVAPPGEATLSIADRGVLFGDGVYEVLRSYSGRLWAFDRHMTRLERSLRQIWIDNVDIQQIRRAASDLYRQSQLPDARLYIQITRGPAERDFPLPQNPRPTVVMTVRALQEDRELRRRGARVITKRDLRWGRVDIKSLNLMANMMAKKEARECGADEAVLVNERGVMTEGASSSLFIARRKTVLTRENGPHILPGVTREIAIECAEEAGLRVRECAYTLDEFRNADEAFLTGTTLGICPLVSADGFPIGGGKPGQIAQTIRQLYNRRVQEQRDAPIAQREERNA